MRVKALPSSSGWIARALARPAAWADAASIAVVSLALGGRPLPCDCHPALQAALDAGGSTEEADEVRSYSRQGVEQVKVT